MKLDGGATKVLLRDVQMHPFRNEILHVDFQRVDENRKIHMKVPLHFVNGEISPAVKLSGAIVSARAERARRLVPAEGPAGIHRGRPVDARRRPLDPRLGAEAAAGRRRSSCAASSIPSSPRPSCRRRIVEEASKRKPCRVPRRGCCRGAAAPGAPGGRGASRPKRSRREEREGRQEGEGRQGRQEEEVSPRVASARRPAAGIRAGLFVARRVDVAASTAIHMGTIDSPRRRPRQSGPRARRHAPQRGLLVRRRARARARRARSRPKAKFHGHVARGGGDLRLLKPGDVHEPVRARRSPALARFFAIAPGGDPRRRTTSSTSCPARRR